MTDLFVLTFECSKYCSKRHYIQAINIFLLANKYILVPDLAALGMKCFKMKWCLFWYWIFNDKLVFFSIFKRNIFQIKIVANAVLSLETDTTNNLK